MTCHHLNFYFIIIPMCRDIHHMRTDEIVDEKKKKRKKQYWSLVIMSLFLMGREVEP